MLSKSLLGNLMSLPQEQKGKFLFKSRATKGGFGLGAVMSLHFATRQVKFKLDIFEVSKAPLMVSSRLLN